MRLHFNKLNGIFSVRRQDRSTVSSSERHGKVSFIGDTFALAPNVHLIVTNGTYREAQRGTRPFVPVLVTRFPKVRLFVARIKEVF